MSTGSIVVDLLARTGSFGDRHGARRQDLAEKRAKEIDAKLSEIGLSIGTKLAWPCPRRLGIAAWGKSPIDGLRRPERRGRRHGVDHREDQRPGGCCRPHRCVHGYRLLGAMVKFNAGLKEADGKNGVRWR